MSHPIPRSHLHRVELVYPGPASLHWLEQTVRALQERDRLTPLTVIVPTPVVSLAVKRTLAIAGCVNVRVVVQLRQVAERVARDGGFTEAAQPLTGVLEAAAIRSAVRTAGGPALGALADHRALQEVLGVLFRELRHLDDPGTALAQLAAGGGVAEAAVHAYRRYEALTAPTPDVPGLVRLAERAATRAAQPAWVAEVGALVVYLPSRLDDSDIALLAALGNHLPVWAGLATFGEDAADHLMREASTALAARLGVALQGPTGTATVRPDLRIVSAPDAEEEVRTVVRRVCADLQANVPLWRTAVLYTQEETYGPLVREMLDLASLPWHGALGRPAAQGWAPRSLVGLLTLRERRFARAAVLDWLASRPPWPAEGTQIADPLPQVPMSAWDRLSRLAQVLEGPLQWVQRFETLLRTLEKEEARRADWKATVVAEENDGPRPPSDVDHAQAIAAAIVRLERDTRPPAEWASWNAFVDWARDLSARYVPVAPEWPMEERAAAEALSAALDDLRAAAAFEPVTTLRVFIEALAAALEQRRLPEGKPGVGVLVGPLGSVLGAAFDRVHVLGLAEGLLPTRPPVDPLAAGADDASDPLGRQERQREGDRRAFLGALAAAGESGAVTLSYPRSDGAARAAHPSRWLLEQVAQRDGVPAVYASDLPRLFTPERTWLDRIASAYDGLQRCASPLDLADLRLSQIVAWRQMDRSVHAHSLASRADLPLGRALHAADARKSRTFTPYDGNVAALARASKLVVRPFTSERGASSATAVERWASCPFQYFLANVLRVEATEQPEDEWTITPADKGTLVHGVLGVFFRELLGQGRCTLDDTFTEADHARLDQIAAEFFHQVEAEGKTGHPLAWDNARAQILADLHAQLARDEAWRREDRLMPALFEQTFGDPHDPESWPAAEVALGNGLVARFRGAIDRMDLTPAGITPRRARVIDYKSGGQWGYDDLEQDPVLAGRHVQLALYARALRTGLAGSADLAEVRAEFRFVTAKGGHERRQIVADARVEERLDRVVRRIATGIQAGVFLPAPGERGQRGFQNCTFCDYDRVCSTTRDETFERKRGVAFVALESLA